MVCCSRCGVSSSVLLFPLFRVSSKEKLRSGHVTSPLDSIMKEMDKIANAKDVCLTKQGQLL